MEIGSTGTLTFGDGTSAKVRLVAVDDLAHWLEYIEGETNRQIIDPRLGFITFVKAEIGLPTDIFPLMVTAD
jgi:hypothetical protein